MLMPTLYRKSITGRIRAWRLEVTDDNGIGKKRSHYGQDEPNTTSAWRTCKAKNVGRANATNSVTQARKEAEAEYVLVKKRGFVESREEAETQVGAFECMLADSYKRGDALPAEMMYVQPKLNGIRLTLSEASGARSRENEEFISMRWLVREFKRQGIFKKYPNVIWDGEIYNHTHRHNFNRILSLVKTERDDLEWEKLVSGELRYNVYDCYDPSCPERGYVKRLALIRDVWNSVPCVGVVSTKAIKTAQEADEYLGAYLDNGYEGAMLRDATAAYDVGRRSAALLKYKSFIDEEFRVVDIIAGEGKFEGTVANFVLELEDGTTFKCPPKNMSLKQGEAVLANRSKYIGKKVTVAYVYKTPLGKPMHGKVLADRLEQSERVEKDFV